MFENIALAFQGVWSHKMRSFLTMLGIIIGIASIIGIVSTIKGTNEQIKENLIGSGNNTVEIKLYTGDWYLDYEYDSIPDGIPAIDKYELKEIEDLDTVESAATFYYREVYDGIYYKELALSGGTLYGVNNSYFSLFGYSAKTGRLFTDKDYENYNKVAVVDSTAARALFQEENPVGKVIEIKGEPYVVVGMIDQASSFKPTINSMDDYYTYMDNSSGKIFVPDTTWPIIYAYDEPQSVIIKATSTDDMTQAGKGASDIINSYLMTTDSEVQYKAEDLLEQAKHLQELSSSTKNQLIWIASISLLVGGIGVMNIMLVSVTERTKEIGLKKAIGARKRRVLIQFLTEAAVLTSLGGIVGVLFGIGLSYGIGSISSAPISISVPAIVVSVVFSMVIGIVFGLIPAIKAANLNPIEALRHE